MEPGIHSNITMAEYLADPCPVPSLSASCALTMIEKSPLHAWQRHPRLGGGDGDDSTAADTGTVAHDLLLGGEGKITVLPFDNYRTKAAQEARDEARAAGKAPILEADFADTRRMVDAALGFLASSELGDEVLLGACGNGKAEQTLVWCEGDAWCRARPDWLRNDHGIMLHYKSSTGSVRPGEFIRRVFASMGYAFTMAFYARGMIAQEVGRTRHYVLAQEQKPPYACSLISLSPAMEAIEDSRVARAIALWQKCQALDTWPGYCQRVHYAEPTAWQVAAEEERRADEEVCDA